MVVAVGRWSFSDVIVSSGFTVVKSTFFSVMYIPQARSSDAQTTATTKASFASTTKISQSLMVNGSSETIIKIIYFITLS